MSYTNADGLYVLTGTAQGTELEQGTSAVAISVTEQYEIDFTAVGTSYTANPMAPVIPARSVILDAYLVMRTGATGAGTLTIGTYTKAGDAVDADGIDAAIATTAIDADNDVVQCDGAQVAGVVTVGSDAVQIGVIRTGAAYTTGRGRLYVTYNKTH
jgi:hypothetical protein